MREVREKVKIGLIDVDGHRFPSLPLMKLSAYHKARGDMVEFVRPLYKYDRVYASRVFGEEYTGQQDLYCQASEIVYGGTGYAIAVEEGKEVYRKALDKELPFEIEHTYPDYSLYPDLTRNTAYGFLTRGCPNNCGFCVVSQKEGLITHKVADLSEFWSGQKYIKLLDANMLACRDRLELLKQLVASNAWVDFTQGLDAKFVTEEIAELLKNIRTKRVHFAFDLMKNERAIINGLKLYKEVTQLPTDKLVVYILTNYDTTIEQDLYRLQKVQELGYFPDIRIYRKPSAPQVLKDLQRWCNNRILFRSCDFMDYIPRRDGKTIRELYFNKKAPRPAATETRHKDK